LPIKRLQQKRGRKSKTAKIAYELRKLRERGAIKKIKTSHYYRLTEEGLKWISYSIFNSSYFVNPLLSASYKNELQASAINPSNLCRKPL